MWWHTIQMEDSVSDSWLVLIQSLFYSLYMKEDKEGGAEDVAEGGAEDVAVVTGEENIRRNFFLLTDTIFIYLFIIKYHDNYNL